MNLRLWDDGLDQFIELPYGGRGAGFRLSELIAHIESSERDFIIQGQQNCPLDQHTKPHSLDVWLRKRLPHRQDTRQAVNHVINVLVATGRFKVADFPCPDSGRRCKGVRLVNEQQP